VKRELTKYIGVDVSFTQSHCHQKTIDLQYMPSEAQLVDFFTKAQTRAHHQFHLIKLNASDPHVKAHKAHIFLSAYIYATVPEGVSLSPNRG
jgi:hypothetical protein